MDKTLDEQHPSRHSLVSRATLFDQHLSTPFLSRYLPQYCSNRLDESGEVINKETGELSPHGCGVLTCTYCVRVKRRAVARAVGASDPEAMLTMTQAPEDIAETTAWMRNVRRNLQRRGFPLEWVWIVECNRRRDGRHEHHVHALAHGAIPPEHVLSDVAQRAGFGPVAEVERLRNVTAATRYLWADKRGEKHPHGIGHPCGSTGEDPQPKKWRTIDMPHRLWTNGGHLQHSSRYFWRVNGERVAGGYKGVLKALQQQREKTDWHEE